MTHLDFPDFISQFKASVSEYIYWQESLIELYLVSLLAGGHLLLVGPPGVAKTKSANIASKVLGLPFKRIQFTSDLLPSDILGAEIYDPKSREFLLRKWPIFSSFVLADEINRAPGKVQSALFECMQEGQVTIANTSLPLDTPFFVVATMNPYDGVGTYTLPEAMLDRFALSYELGYPEAEVEAKILAASEKQVGVNAICTPSQIEEFKQFCLEETFVDEKIYEYIARLITYTRSLSGEQIVSGISTRSALALSASAKVYARMQGRNFVIPEDIKYLLPFVLSHRLRLTFAAISKWVTVQSCIRGILDSVPVEYESAS